MKKIIGAFILSLLSELSGCNAAMEQPMINEESEKDSQSIDSTQADNAEQVSAGTLLQDERELFCSKDMILIEGSYCTTIEQKCIDWMEDPLQNKFARCMEFESPTTCVGPIVPMRYCIDRYEAAEDGDESALPVSDVSWTQAKAACESLGKRLCTEDEWTFACEGEEMRPYPYGFVRDSSLCNFDLVENIVTQKGELWDHRMPIRSNPNCLSPFGVQNMVGNEDEWVVSKKPYYIGVKKMSSLLAGGWWGALRNRCRAKTYGHDHVFHQLQTGYRCCSEAK